MEVVPEKAFKQEKKSFRQEDPSIIIAFQWHRCELVMCYGSEPGIRLFSHSNSGHLCKPKCFKENNFLPNLKHEGGNDSGAEQLTAISFKSHQKTA